MRLFLSERKHTIGAGMPIGGNTLRNFAEEFLGDSSERLLR